MTWEPGFMAWMSSMVNCRGMSTLGAPRTPLPPEPIWASDRAGASSGAYTKSDSSSRESVSVDTGSSPVMTDQFTAGSWGSSSGS